MHGPGIAEIVKAVVDELAQGPEAMNRDGPSVVFLTGPTATGKTDIAVELVRHLPCDIVSVDSAMVYKGLDIGTAKPGPEVRDLAPHRLIDICDPAESYSAARFRADALDEIAEITAAGRIPLLVGGTMLYFRALERGLSRLPAADQAVRERLVRELRAQGSQALHGRLSNVDPDAAARIHHNDPQRILRALEVYEIEGQPMSALVARGCGAPFPFRVAKVQVLPSDRAELHRRIRERFHQMLTRGLLGEVEGLHARRDLHSGLPSIRSVGYRQLWRYLDGDLGYEEAVRQAIVATRRLAKRQMTWLRAETAGRRFDSSDTDLRDKVLKYIAEVTIN